MTFHTPDEDKAGLKKAVGLQEGLPCVLLIGDSISIGYTEPVRRKLRGVCNVCRPEANCGDTRNGLVHMGSWLDDRVWDLIHFNWGLHDLCYRNPEATVYGNRDKANGSISVKPELYRANLEKLVQMMRPRARRLVWASTTYIPAGEAGRNQGDDVRYNALAGEVMSKHGIPTDDLHEVTQAFPPAMFARQGDVHYTKQGYEKIADVVSEYIRKQLTRHEHESVNRGGD